MISLADLAGVSPQSIYAYEANRSTPGPQVLLDLASAVSLPEAYFLRPARQEGQGTIYYRSMASATKTARRRADSRVHWLRDLVAYIEEYVALPEPNFPVLDLPDDPLLISDDEIEAAAEDLRAYWRLGEDPIANMVLLLENQGAVVARGTLGAETMDGLSLRDGARPYVFIGTDKGSAVRWRFDAAHELGHVMLHAHVSAAIFESREHHHRMEQQAHRFAGAFLLPLAPFGEDLFAINLDVLRSLKQRWKTSISMMIVRARQAGFLGEDAERKLWIQMSRRKWRKSEPLDDTMPAEEPRLLRRSLELILAQGAQTSADIAERLALQPPDIETLSNLPAGYLTNYSRVSLVANDGGGRVIPFRRDSGRPET